MVIGVPLVAIASAGWFAGGGGLRWQDLLVLASMYSLAGLGAGRPKRGRRWAWFPRAGVLPDPGGLYRLVENAGAVASS